MAGGILEGRRVFLAETPEERARGMAGVADASGIAMVFAAQPGDVFWMRGCLAALDLVFVDADGRVLGVSTLRPPADGEEPARAECPQGTAAVVEVEAGAAEAAGLSPGDDIG